MFEEKDVVSEAATLYHVGQISKEEYFNRLWKEAEREVRELREGRYQ